jgi:hypothetical protein
MKILAIENRDCRPTNPLKVWAKPSSGTTAREGANR